MSVPIEISVEHMARVRADARIRGCNSGAVISQAIDDSDLYRGQLNQATDAVIERDNRIKNAVEYVQTKLWVRKDDAEELVQILCGTTEAGYNEIQTG